MCEAWAGASYPPPYHWAVFALAEPATALFNLTPYQSTYAYRLASVFLAGWVWGLVYWLLDEQLGGAAAARAAYFLLSIPMLAFSSAGVQPDGLALPLAAAAVVAAWRLGETGERPALAASLLLAVALAKPSGLPVIGAVMASAAMVWGIGGFNRHRAFLVALSATVALGFAYGVFYAWSPPRFLGGVPVSPGLAECASTLPRRAAGLWIGYWGWLGWLDTRLGWPWYGWLMPVVGLNAVIAAGAIRRRLGATFLPGVTAVVTAILFVGEFVYLPQAGYNLMGKHFLVGAVGLVPLVAHERPWAWAALLAYLTLLHVRLAWETFLRYYAGDAGVLWAALPFM